MFNLISIAYVLFQGEERQLNIISKTTPDWYAKTHDQRTLANGLRTMMVHGTRLSAMEKCICSKDEKSDFYKSTAISF